jgi:hypothetical protein
MRITTENVEDVIANVSLARPVPSFRVSNRPIVNLLASFIAFYNSAHEPVWLLALERYGTEPSLRNFNKDNYLSLLVGTVILDFETYIKYAIWITGYLAGFTDYGKRTKKLPRGMSTVDYLFNRLPDELHPDLPIDKADPGIASFLRALYKNVRNPLFDGDQLTGPTAYDFLCLLEWYRRAYEWAAKWKTVDFYVEYEENRLQIRELQPNGQVGFDQRRQEFLFRRSVVQVADQISSST